MSVATKNPFDLLGDDGDSDATGPVRAADKKSTRTAKGNAAGEAASNKPSLPAPRRGAYGGGNEAAFRDRGVGSDRNRGKPTDDSRGPPRGGHNARVRGGRGSRYPRDRDDRHSKSAPSGGSGKEAAGGWGATEGEAELKDEQAGEEIAKKDDNDATAENADDAAKAEPEEPEDKSVSYADYLAQQAEKKLALEEEASLKLRKANEGTKNNKQWATAKELVKDEDDFFMGGGGGKTKRERERKVKQVVELDNRYIEPDRPRGGGRGGRSDYRGGRGGGRGGGERSDRGDRAERGDRGGYRGDFRGGRGGGPRGGPGGGGLNPKDERAFPSLGS